MKSSEETKHDLNLKKIRHAIASGAKSFILRRTVFGKEKEKEKSIFYLSPSPRFFRTASPEL